MMIKMHQLTFMTTLISGTIVAISANSMFTAWLGLEVNLMSMIPLMLITLNKKMTEAAIKYFLTQALASLLLLICMVMTFTLNEMLGLETMELLLISALLMKIGGAPFHFWFPQVIELSNWLQCTILMTWQKIAPFILLSMTTNKIITTMAVMSAVIGSLGGINQMKLKLILTYSSISHTGWMIMTINCNTLYWFLYFTVYSFLLITVICMVNSSFNFNYINELNLWKTNKKMKFMLILNMMSLGGLPPLVGFVSKLIVIKALLELNMIFIMMLMVGTSLLSLYFYCRVIYSAMMINSSKSIMDKKTYKIQANWYVFVTTFNILIPVLIML